MERVPLVWLLHLRGLVYLQSSSSLLQYTQKHKGKFFGFPQVTRKTNNENSQRTGCCFSNQLGHFYWPNTLLSIQKLPGTSKKFGTCHWKHQTTDSSFQLTSSRLFRADQILQVKFTKFNGDFLGVSHESEEARENMQLGGCAAIESWNKHKTRAWMSVSWPVKLFSSALDDNLRCQGIQPKIPHSVLHHPESTSKWAATLKD